MPQGQLAQVLRDVTGEHDDRLVVGPESVDDAGVVRLGHGEGPYLVQTVDYFPPVVDDPWFYGAIAAANALSDVYAMGGEPHSALNLAGFPKEFPEDWIREIFRGGFAKVREAGAVVAGGHTVQSKEALFGFSVTGTVDPAEVATNANARAGDVLYLTKSIGMGALTTAAKRGVIGWDALRPAAEQMATLNEQAARAMRIAGARACTDVTGFGLAGHARNVALSSGVTLRITAADVPIFPGALELSREGVLSGGSRRGRSSLGGVVRVAEDVEDALAALAFDAETSGGLLIAITEERAVVLDRELDARGVFHRRIGECVARVGDTLVELV